MAKNGSTIDSALSKNLGLALGFGKDQRQMRDESQIQKSYQGALQEINLILDHAIEEAENNPENGIMVTRQCTWFVMEAMPDQKQDIGRATLLNQCKVLETCLAEVRKPNEYLVSMREQYGPNLDPRNYPAAVDAFSSTIKSQRQRLYTESQGFNTPQEKMFCVKRRKLLTAVERGYNRLRAQALGISPPENKRGHNR